jgi:hypothetical protein
VNPCKFAPLTVFAKLVECHFSLTNFRSRDVIDVVLFRIGVIGFPLECAVRLAISRTDTPVCIHGAMKKGQFTRKNVKSEKPCSIADLTHFRSRDVYQTYAIRLPDGGLRIDSHLCSAVTGRLHLFHMPASRNSTIPKFCTVNSELTVQNY